ncbi:MAG: hypothetical protein ACOYL6_15695 [Bacteriovoracaceae bacterium]
MKTLFTLMIFSSLNAFAQNSEFTHFNQSLVESLSKDVNEISHFVKKEEDIKQKRLPATAKLEMAKLQVSVYDVSRYQSNKPQFLKSKQTTYEIDQIRNFDYKNYYVNGTNSF